MVKNDWMMPSPVIASGMAGAANRRKKYIASLFGSRGSANSSSAPATIMKTQKLCARNALSVMPNHRLRRRSKSPLAIADAQAGALANANTTAARTRMATSARRCSGMAGLRRFARPDDPCEDAVEDQQGQQRRDQQHDARRAMQ